MEHFTTIQNSVPPLRRVYWETTAGCNLHCIHCRRIDVAEAVSPEELTTAESKKFIDDLTTFGKPVLILSGGEPLFRRDIFEIAAYAKEKGLPVAISTNGTLVNKNMSDKIQAAGIYYASISLDGARAETHDRFRGKGSFERAMRGFLNLKNAGIKVQINFTVTKQNELEIPEMYDLARLIGAHALYLFLLVPVGCGIQIAQAQMLESKKIDEWLKWVCEKEDDSSLELRLICAPHYYRVKETLKKSSHNGKRLGCLAGINICFVSHKGDVFPCGYLPVSSGNIKTNPLSEIWKQSETFRSLRDYNLLQGLCGACDFKTVCGGCRARGYYQHGSILAEEPFCDYKPALSSNAR